MPSSVGATFPNFYYNNLDVDKSFANAIFGSRGGSASSTVRVMWISFVNQSAVNNVPIWFTGFPSGKRYGTVVVPWTGIPKIWSTPFYASGGLSFFTDSNSALIGVTVAYVDA